MNPSNLTGAFLGSMPIVKNTKDRMHNMQVEDTELRILITDLYNHLGVTPREGTYQEAQVLLNHMNQAQAIALAEQKYNERQFAYMNGSVLEKFRRFIGGHPMSPSQIIQPMSNMNMGMNPMNPMNPIYQGMNMQLPQGQVMQQAPQQAGPSSDFLALQKQVNDLTGAVSQITTLLTSISAPVASTNAPEPPEHQSIPLGGNVI